MPVKEVNKSEEVRKLYKSGVKSASEIVAKLKARGIDVAPSQAYQVISSKKKRRRTGIPKTAPTNHSTEKQDVIDHAVQFVRSAGGMDKAKQLLSKLSLLHN